jgi:hypothetical protein
MISNRELKKYQFNVNDEELAYWIDVFYRDKLKTPNTLERLLAGK